MHQAKHSVIDRGSIYAILLSLCVVSTAAIASDDTVQSKTVPYKDAAGNAQMLSLLGGDGLDLARNVICGKDDACTLFGFTNKSFGDTTDFLVIHLTPKSDVAWAETFGGTNRDMLYNAVPTGDGGYFTSGESESMFFTGLKIFSPHRDPRPMYVKLDASGKLLWAGNVELGGQISSAEIAKTIQTSDGGYLLVGSYSEAYPESGERPMPDEWSGPGFANTKGWKYFYPLVVKLASDGKPQWMRRYAFGDEGGMATSFALMPSGHVLIAGSIFTSDSDNKLFIMEIDAQGVPVHTQRYDLPASQGSNAFLRLQDGNYLVVGHANVQKAAPRAFSALLSADAKFITGTIYADPNGVRALGMTQAAGGAICIVGRTENGNTNKAEGVAWLIDEHTADLGEFWLTGAGNTEFEDAAPLSTGGFRLIGDTAAFGAASYDLITIIWTLNTSAVPAAKRLTEEPYKPTISDITATSDTGKLDLVRNIPVDLIKLKALGAPASDTKN